jgi:DNA-binding GntR family transcriptional regulator
MDVFAGATKKGTMADTDSNLQQRQRGGPPPGSRPSVVDRLTDAIRLAVVEGRYVPGQRLVESDLTEEFSVSRGPLREALKRLEAEGLVDIVPHRGAAVRKPSPAELEELFQVREVLEGLAARLAAENAGAPEVRRRLEREVEAQRGGKEGFDTLDYIEDNERFHRTIVEVAGSPMLDRMIQQLRMPVYRAAFFRLFKASNRGRSVGQHLAILEAILAGDADRAEREMRGHVGDTAALARTISQAIVSS